MVVAHKERFISWAFYIAATAVIVPHIIGAWHEYLIDPGVVNNNPLDTRIGVMLVQISLVLPLTLVLLALGYFTPVWTKRWSTGKNSRWRVVLFGLGISGVGIICNILWTFFCSF
jgi:hypothetical protein